MPKHILSSEQFTTSELSELFERADHFRQRDETTKGRCKNIKRHVGARVTSLFYEPSTRTRLSFEKAASALGATYTMTECADMFSSVTKGETLEDTIRVLNAYNDDIIVLRHKETGAAVRAAAVSDRASIINGGDGKGEHPTQAALDLYTIQRNHGRLDHLNVIIGGDLANGRTARSLAKLLAHYAGNSLQFVSTPELGISNDIKAYLADHDTVFSETADAQEAFTTADVIYWTRLQAERMTEEELQAVSANYTIDTSMLTYIPEHTSILHPLPRVNEISTDIDRDPRARYFQQAGNGLYMRMAMIDQILSS